MCKFPTLVREIDGRVKTRISLCRNDLQAEIVRGAHAVGAGRLPGGGAAGGIEPCERRWPRGRLRPGCGGPPVGCRDVAVRVAGTLVLEAGTGTGVVGVIKMPLLVWRNGFAAPAASHPTGGDAFGHGGADLLVLPTVTSAAGGAAPRCCGLAESSARAHSVASHGCPPCLCRPDPHRQGSARPRARHQ